MRDTERDRERQRQRETERQRHRQREKQAPCREPDVGLDPRSPGSGPGPKAGAKPLSHSGIPKGGFKWMTPDGFGANVMSPYRQAQACPWVGGGDPDSHCATGTDI